MLKRLAVFQRQNQLDLALQELGRIERRMFMLDRLKLSQFQQQERRGKPVPPELLVHTSPLREEHIGLFGISCGTAPPRLRGSAGRSISGAKEWQPENDARWWALALIRMGTISANARLIDPRRNATQDELF